jgi:hypothetical protein
LNILGEFGIIHTAIEMAEDGGPAAHDKPRRARFQASKPKLKIIVRECTNVSRQSSVLKGVLMTNKTLFWSFYVNFCTFCASLRPKRTVFTRLQIKVRPKGLHNFAFYILIFDFPSRSLPAYQVSLWSLPTYKVGLWSLPTYKVGQYNPWLINDLRLRILTYEIINFFCKTNPNSEKVK